MSLQTCKKKAKNKIFKTFVRSTIISKSRRQPLASVFSSSRSQVVVYDNLTGNFYFGLMHGILLWFKSKKVGLNKIVKQAYAANIIDLYLQPTLLLWNALDMGKLPDHIKDAKFKVSDAVIAKIVIKTASLILAINFGSVAVEVIL